MENYENRPPINPDQPNTDLLDKINSAFADLGYNRKARRAPEFLESYAPLRDKKVLMVDDMKNVLQHFAPFFVVATDGKVSFVEYKEQKLEELIREILERNPDIVVMDYHLSKNLKGPSVIRALIENKFAGDVIGFSSDSAAEGEFMSAGAKGAAEKDTAEPEKSVAKIAEFFSKK